MKTVGIVFGVFDGLHEGHKYFLSEASKKCDLLIVVITQEKIVQLLKNKTPKYSFIERCDEIKKYNATLIIKPGDHTLGEWSVFKEYSSYQVILGYDQQGIAHELQKMNISYTTLAPYHPEKYKSSLLN